jgi:UDP-N-acetylmuramoyl-L-alanyl-D-glutamate--2,6-diaminopimelate ligase
MVDGGDVAAAIEVSSHALDLGRVDGTRFSASVFTNLSQDHLDWHGTMENYWLSKKRLFTELPHGVPVINIDDEYGRVLTAEVSGAVTVGFSDDAAWRASGLDTGLTGSRFNIHSPDGETAISMKLPGQFNVLNALGAAAAVASVGVPFDAIVTGLESANGVPGRFEPVQAGQPFAVLVDYAHTPDSLENVLRAARRIASNKVICVVGCGGDRDSTKRPIMGRIVSDLADVPILTSDNPRSEDPELILAEMAAGASGSAHVEVDRREAVRLAIESAAEGDVVLIAGKGHEQGQEFADGLKLPFDDRSVASEILAEAGWAG